MIKKEKYKYRDRDDLDYRGIRDIENLFDNVDDNDYYKPTLAKSSFTEESIVLKGSVVI